MSKISDRNGYAYKPLRRYHTLFLYRTVFKSDEYCKDISTDKSVVLRY